ncbi:MAG: hypothetical protein V4543_14690 [Bacteroidota bacterium]
MSVFTTFAKKPLSTLAKKIAGKDRELKAKRKAEAKAFKRVSVPAGDTDISIRDSGMSRSTAIALGAVGVAVVLAGIALFAKTGLSDAKQEAEDFRVKLAKRLTLLEYKMYSLIARINRDDPQATMPESVRIVQLLNELDRERNAVLDLSEKLSRFSPRGWKELKRDVKATLADTTRVI